MAFETLSERQRQVATESLGLCRARWGNNGVKLEQSIDAKVGWQPTFHMKPSKNLIVAVEVNDVLFPEVLKGAAHDIEHHDFPIAVYQACSLDVYQQDPRLARSTQLKDHGFGLITVDDAGNPSLMVEAQPLAQHIPQQRFDAEIKSLTPKLKVKFQSAYSTYRTNVGQGLQEAGQIIEAIVKSICEQAEKKNVVQAGTASQVTASIIDDLYSTAVFKPCRAALGGARNFAKSFRNIVSHPATTPKQAAERLRKCKTGFLDSMRLATDLKAVQNIGYKIIIQ